MFGSMFGSIFGALTAAFHFVTKRLNLLTEHTVEEILFKLRTAADIAVTSSWVFFEFLVGPALDGYDDEERCDKGFFQIRKAEVFGDLRNGFAKLWREVDCLIGC